MVAAVISTTRSSWSTNMPLPAANSAQSLGIRNMTAAAHRYRVQGRCKPFIRLLL
ncbi:hypothetical protein PA07A_2292 [Cutibacterium acnes P07A]|nr:hypothetical protein [Cutibacterium acnes P07A]